MKLTKYFSLLISAAFALTLTSCGGDDDDTGGGSTGSSLVVTPTEMSFEAAGGTQTFTVNVASPYVNSQASWLTVAKTSSTANSSTYTVTCAAQTAYTDRTGTIVVNNNNGTPVKVNVTQKAAVKEQEQSYTFRSANAVAKDMYPGWNLGNTMEACNNANNFTNKGGVGCETSWQGTKTTQAIIDAVKAAGFKSVRIPVAWVAGHVTGTEANPQLDKEWLARVKEIVDYCIKDGLYVIINDHWDGGWLEVLGFSSNSSSYVTVDDSYVDGKIVTLKNLWTNIADAFQNYDEHLIFAGLNEPFQEYSLFNSRHQALTPILVKYNKAFVEAVRATGGNNANRILVVQGPSVNIDSSVKYMTSTSLPESAGKLMVEVHYYDPGQFCGTYDSSGDKAYYYWGSANHGSDHNPTYGEESYLQQKFTSLKNTYTSKGYPVIIGEYAGLQRTLTAAGTSQTKHDASVKAFYQTINQFATSNGCVAFAWDTNDVSGLGKESGSSTIIDRAKATVVGKNAMEGILAGCKAGAWPY